MASDSCRVSRLSSGDRYEPRLQAAGRFGSALNEIDGEGRDVFEPTLRQQRREPQFAKADLLRWKARGAVMQNSLYSHPSPLFREVIGEEFETAGPIEVKRGVGLSLSYWITDCLEG